MPKIIRMAERKKKLLRIVNVRTIKWNKEFYFEICYQFEEESNEQVLQISLVVSLLVCVFENIGNILSILGKYRLLSLNFAMSEKSLI